MYENPCQVAVMMHFSDFERFMLCVVRNCMKYHMVECKVDHYEYSCSIPGLGIRSSIRRNGTKPPWIGANLNSSHPYQQPPIATALGT